MGLSYFSDLDLIVAFHDIKFALTYNFVSMCDSLWAVLEMTINALCKILLAKVGKMMMGESFTLNKGGIVTSDESKDSLE